MSQIELQTQQFCRLYREQTEAAFDRALSEIENVHLMNEGELSERLQEALVTAETEWFDAEQDALRQMTPRAFVQSLESTEDRLEFIRTSALHMDEALPPELANILRAHAGDLEPQLTEWAEQGHQIAFDGSENLPSELLLAMRAADLLGKWRVPPSRSRLLDSYIKIDEPAPIWSETVQHYLEAQGAPAIDPIVALIDREHEEYGEAGSAAKRSGQPELRERREAEDYLLMALTAIGQDAPDERIYRILRRSFKETSPRLIPVICLGDYGDPRAVTLLRHYLIREASMTDEMTYYEIVSTIQRLGGQIDDLPDPFTPNNMKR